MNLVPIGFREGLFISAGTELAIRPTSRLPTLFPENVIEPPEASFGFPIATGSTFRNLGFMVRIPHVCSIMS